MSDNETFYFTNSFNIIRHQKIKKNINSPSRINTLLNAEMKCDLIYRLSFILSDISHNHN